MAEKKGSSNLKFTPVTVTMSVGQVERDPAGGVIHPTGRLPLNIEGTMAWNQVARDSGIDPREAGVWFGVIEESKLVGAYAVPATSQAAKAGIRRDEKRKSATLYLGSVFAEYPSLRVEGKRAISVGADVDADGRPCLVIALNSTLPSRKGQSRQTEKSTAGGNGQQRQANSRAKETAKGEPAQGESAKGESTKGESA